MFGIQELSMLLVIVLVLFGGKKVPELARNIGQSVREVKSAFNEDAADKSLNFIKTIMKCTVIIQSYSAFFDEKNMPLGLL